MLTKDPLLFARAQKNMALLQAFLVFLLSTCAVAILRWISLRYLNPADEQGTVWWVLTVSAVVCIATVVILCAVVAFQALKEVKTAGRRLQEEAQKAYVGRAALRARTLNFAERTFFEYDWILTMNEEHQRLRALQEWYEQMVNSWRQEHDEFAALRATDDRNLVIEDLDRDHAGLGTRLLKLLEARKVLYHYTVRYANDHDRKKEILKLEERINVEKGDFDDRQDDREQERAGRKQIVVRDQSPEDAL